MKCDYHKNDDSYFNFCRCSELLKGRKKKRSTGIIFGKGYFIALPNYHKERPWERLKDTIPYYISKEMGSMVFSLHFYTYWLKRYRYKKIQDWLKKRNKNINTKTKRQKEKQKKINEIINGQFTIF